MWLLYTILYALTDSIVQYIDERLAIDNIVSKESTVHKKIGGVVIMSTVLSFVGAFILFLFLEGNIAISETAMNLGLVSGIFMVLIYILLFYLLQFYSSHQIVPLLQLSSIWLLSIEIIFGASISLVILTGIILLILGAYFIDTDSFEWKVPGRLFSIMLAVGLFWAISLFMVRIASINDPTTVVYFYQLIMVGTLGVLITIFVKPYRDGCIERIKKQGKSFVGFSLVNESLSQLGYLFAALAVAVAPLATYFTALGGLHSIFVIGLFWLFPIHKRNKITKIQIFAVILIVIGVFIIEFLK